MRKLSLYFPQLEEEEEKNTHSWNEAPVSIHLSLHSPTNIRRSSSQIYKTFASS